MKRKTRELTLNTNQARSRTIIMWLRWLGYIIGPPCAFAMAFCMLSAGAASVCLALPPANGNCDQSDVYDKLKCKHDSVAAQVEYMATNIFAEGTLLGDQLTPGQRGQVRSLKENSERARNKSAKEDFKKLAKSSAKSNKNACHLVPLRPEDDGNNDGICDYEQGVSGAECAAIELDINGNLQKCNPDKKNKGKGKYGLECDQICDPDEAVTNDEETEMQAEAAPMGEAYDALATDLSDLNGELENLNSSTTALAFSRAVSASTDACDMPPTTPNLGLAAAILRQVSVTARALGGMANTGCEQVAVALGFGGNGSVVCLTFQTAAGVLEIAYVTVDEINKKETRALQDSTLLCLRQSQGDMDAGFQNLYNQHGQIMANDNSNTVQIMNKIEQVRAELVQLLNTPQGQRSFFPTK